MFHGKFRIIFNAFNVFIKIMIITFFFRCTERFDNFEYSKATCLFQMYVSGSELWVIPEAFLIEYHYNRHSYLLKPVESEWEVRIN